MKKLMTILFALVALSCFAQEFDSASWSRFKLIEELKDSGVSGTAATMEFKPPSMTSGLTTAFAPKTVAFIMGTNPKAALKFSFEKDSILTTYTNLDSAGVVLANEVQKIIQQKMNDKQRVIDSLKNANDCKLDHNQASCGTSYRNENDEEIISTSSLGYIKILGKTICDPDTTIRNFLDFNQTWCNKLLPTIDPKSGERGFNGYRSIKEKKLLVLHLTYVKDGPYYPFTEKWIPSTEIDKYYPEWVLDRYVLVGDGK